eukprot:scaffold6068_cov119-Isochrysis_galbana.AAC.29
MAQRLRATSPSARGGGRGAARRCPPVGLVCSRCRSLQLTLRHDAREHALDELVEVEHAVLVQVGGAWDVRAVHPEAYSSHGHADGAAALDVGLLEDLDRLLQRRLWQSGDGIADHERRRRLREEDAILNVFVVITARVDVDECLLRRSEALQHADKFGQVHAAANVALDCIKDCVVIKILHVVVLFLTDVAHTTGMVLDGKEADMLPEGEHLLGEELPIAVAVELFERLHGELQLLVAKLGELVGVAICLHQVIVIGVVADAAVGAEAAQSRICPALGGAKAVFGQDIELFPTRSLAGVFGCLRLRARCR